MISIQYNTKGMEKAVRWAEGLEARVTRAIDQSMMNGGGKVRTDVRRALMQVSGAKKYGSVVSRTSSRFNGFHGASIYTIFVKGGPMRLDEFAFKAGPSGISASLWGRDRLFKRSFVMPCRDAGNPANFRARLPGNHKALRRLHGPNLAKEATTGQPASVFLLSTRMQVGEELWKRLGKALG